MRSRRIHCRGRVGILVAAVCWAIAAGTAEATRWTLLNYGASTKMPYPNWNQLIRHPTRSQIVFPDGNSNHCGIADVEGLGETEHSYAGVRGAAPINRARGHEIIATFYNRTEGYALPTFRVSFKDQDAPDPADPDPANPTNVWYTIYNADININTAWVPPRSYISRTFAPRAGARLTRSTMSSA